MAQVELARPPAIDGGGRRDNRAVQIGGRRVVSGLAGKLAQRHVSLLAVRPSDVDRRRSITLLVNLGNHEVPLCVVALVVVERSGFHGNGLCGGSRRCSVLRGNVAARRTRRAEEHEYEADQAEHAGEE